MHLNDLPEVIFIEGQIEYPSIISKDCVDGWVCTHSVLHEHKLSENKFDLWFIIQKTGAGNQWMFSYKPFLLGVDPNFVRVEGIVLAASGEFDECLIEISKSLNELSNKINLGFE